MKIPESIFMHSTKTGTRFFLGRKDPSDIEYIRKPEPENWQHNFVSLENILKAIKITTGIDIMQEKSRKPLYANLRFMYYKFSEDAPYTLDKIGKTINRSHPSVLDGRKKFDQYYETEKDFARLFNEIKENLVKLSKQPNSE
jgi:chromosomal replication initiation ATPase DnaA